MDMNLLLTIFAAVAMVVLLQCLIAQAKVSAAKDGSFSRKNQVHLVRRIQHMATGVIILTITFVLDQTQCTWASFAGFAFLFTVNILRKLSPSFQDYFIKHFGTLLRPHEVQGAPAALYFLLGVFLSVLLFDFDVARLCLLFVTFGDPTASLLGISIKAPFIIEGHSLSGSGGCSLVCGLAGLLYFMNQGLRLKHKQLNNVSEGEFFLVSCVIGLVSELLPAPRKLNLDDNLMIQIYTGIQFTSYFKLRS